MLIGMLEYLCLGVVEFSEYGIWDIIIYPLSSNSSCS